MPVCPVKGPSEISHRGQSFCFLLSFILSVRLLLSKGPCHARESVRTRDCLQLSTPLTAPRLRAPHRAKDVGSALKGGVNACQRLLVNEVFGPLVTEFVRNFGRERTTPIQLGLFWSVAVMSNLVPVDGSEMSLAGIQRPAE
jgi:hypothetical protein